MGFLRRHRVGVGLLGLVGLLGTLVTYRLKDQQARAVARARPDVLVGVVAPERNVTSFMNIIMMAGIVVSNGVLLVEYINELRRHGLGLHEAVRRAGRARLRPILMTSLTTLVGLFPMALGIDVGSEANAPLARAVIGGLAVSTALTLLLIPTLYVMIDERFPRRVTAPDAALVLEGETR